MLVLHSRVLVAGSLPDEVAEAQAMLNKWGIPVTLVMVPMAEIRRRMPVEPCVVIVDPRNCYDIPPGTKFAILERHPVYDVASLLPLLSVQWSCEVKPKDVAKALARFARDIAVVSGDV